ncbi:MAG: RNA polymerase sigma factor [Thermomicrobiales bacterium]
MSDLPRETTTGIEDLLRELAPQVLGALMRRYGNFDAAEDAVQDAMLAAFGQWPDQGIPTNPRGWLITVAVRRMTDQWRSEAARQRRELHSFSMKPSQDFAAPGADDELDTAEDDSLKLIFMCCHPSLTAASQISLTLRAVGGLTTGEIARAFLVPEATMAQRISRAKATVKSSKAPFQMPEAPERAERMRVVLHVLYLIFNEGYTSSEGPDLQRIELTREAIRLTRQVRRILPDDGEVAGLLALMLLTDARRHARSGFDGELIPLSDQDRSLWNRSMIAEGLAIIGDALARAEVGPYQVQAAIAALHDEAPSAGETDWAQIVSLYELLQQLMPSPVVSLNHAVAVAMVHGPDSGLAILQTLESSGDLKGNHRLDAVRAHLLERSGDRSGAIESYRLAANRTQSLPEQAYLEARAARLASLE